MECPPVCTVLRPRGRASLALRVPGAKESFFPAYNEVVVVWSGQPWTLHLVVLWAWKEGTTPANLVATKMTLLYKKGVTTEAVHYRPIFVNPPMYLAFIKIVHWRYATPIMQSPDEYQYAVKERTTTNMRCLNLMHAVMAQGSKWRDRFICKLAVAKASPSVPHPLLFHMMERLGWDKNVLQAFRESLGKIVCICQVRKEQVT